MSIRFIKGDIFSSQWQTLVNPVNCVGVMGKGLALRFKQTYPDMYKKYKYYCDKKCLSPGLLWLYNCPDGKRVLCFPTKIDWRNPTKAEWIEEGLVKFCQTYKSKHITSAAFPLLGAGCGGLKETVSADMLIKHLSNVDIPIEIYVNNIPLSDKLKRGVELYPRKQKALSST